MAGTNQITRLRQAFAIPDSVTIIAAHNLLPPKQKAPAAHSDFDIDDTDTADEELYRSSLGTPVFANVEFLQGQYETNTTGVFNQFGPLRYEAVLMTVSQAKNIEKTKIQGRNGTVKEYIGDDDYAITINGIITGPNGHYPIDEVAELKKVLDAPIAIDVASRYLQNLGIHSIVVESYDIEQKEGGYSYQTFSLSCVSDIPQELRLTNI